MKPQDGVAQLFRKRPRLAAAFVVVAVLYFPARVFLLDFFYRSALFDPLSSDTVLYARYAFVFQYASEKGLPFFEFYRRLMFLRHPAPVPGAPADTSAAVIGYPPLALAVMNIPAELIRQDRSIMRTDLAGFLGPYQHLYRLLCMVLECAGVLAVCLLISRLYKTEPLFDIVLRVVFLCGAGLLMPHIVYDRLDVILGAMVALSLAALLVRSPALSFVMLALAVNFKLVPLLLVPVWVLGSLRAGDYVRYGLRDRVVRLSTAFAVRGALIGCMAIAVFLLFFLKWGKGVFGFLSFFDRSVHVESLWGSLALLITVLSGTPADLTHGYGAFNVAGPAADFLKAVSPALMVCALAGLTAAVIARCIRAAASGPLTERDGPLLSPSLTVTAALAFLLAVFSLSKVFSPQFLLVAVPVAALAPFTTKEKVYFYAAFAAACLLSTALYPFCYFTEVVPRPTAFGIFLLAARSLLLAGMAVFTAFRLLTMPVGGNALPGAGQYALSGRKAS